MEEIERQSLNFKQFDKDLPKPTYATDGSVGLDLYARETIVIGPGKMGLVPLNIAVQTPKGYATKLYPRSSLFKKQQVILANSVGIIDQDYSGPNDEIKAALYNTNPTYNSIIEKGSRICQLVFTRVDTFELEELEDFEDTEDRGGFGSTDK